MGTMDAHLYRWILIMSFTVQDTFQAATNSSELQCYVCSVSSKKYRLDNFHPCIKNATSLFTQVCTPTQKYCKVEATLRYNQLISLQRNCANSCERGCLRYTYAMWKVICTDCCTESKCNVEGSVSQSKANYWLIIISMLSVHFMACLASKVVDPRFDYE